MFIVGAVIMSYMIFGGFGFLGQNLCRMLSNKGCPVIMFGRKSKRALILEKYLRNEGVNFETVWGDFEHENTWDKQLTGVKVVFHLISTTKPSNENLEYEFTSNVQPTIKLFETCARLGIKVIFFSSGGTVYGVPRYLPIDEQHPTEPISTYGIAKLAIEKCLSYYGYTSGLNYRILRISNPYGIGQNPDCKQGLIGVALAKALRGQNIEVWGSGNVVRDYIYVDDLMEAVFSIMNYEGDVRIFNIGNTRGYSVGEIIELIQRFVKPRVSVEHHEGRVQDVPVNILSHEIVTEETGWYPRVALDEGIKRMIHAWDSERGQFFLKQSRKLL